MNDKPVPVFRLDSFNLVSFVFRHWKLFLITAIVASVVSVIVSLTLTPLYRSTVTLYPASVLTTGTPQLFSEESVAIGFGDEEATEKILQILMSDSIRDYISKKYDLANHYGIDMDSKYPYSQLSARMNKNIVFRKTRFMSVEIDVLDSDPEIASHIANDIAALIDTSFNSMIKEAGKKYLDVIESQYIIQQGIVKAYEDSLSSGGLWREAVSGYNPVSARNSGVPLRSPGLRPFTPEYIRLSTGHDNSIEELSVLRKKLAEARMDANEDLPYTMVVNHARVAERKAFPDRSTIVILSVLSTLLFVFLVAMLVEGIKREDE
jgi:capsular polysaccharide biosynthesis protein